MNFAILFSRVEPNAWPRLALVAMALSGCESPDAISVSGKTPTATSGHPAPHTTAPTASANAPATTAVVEAGPPTPPLVPRVYALTRNVWVRERRDSNSQWLGFLWVGGSAELVDEDPKAGPGCQKWYAVKPRGFVCAMGKRATIDPDDPVRLGLMPYAPKLDTPWPHQYAKSNEAQRYQELPSQKLQRRREWDLESHLTRTAALLDGGATDSTKAAELAVRPQGPVLLPKLPRTLRMDRQRMRARSTVAWSAEVEHEGRPFLLTADYAWIPKDRLTEYPKITFAGLHLPRDAKMPLAFFRGQDYPKYKRISDTEFEKTNQQFRRLSHVELSGKSLSVGEHRYLETRDDGLYTRAQDAVVPQLRAKTPWGAPLGDAPDTTGKTPGGRKTWIDVSVLGGWLLAYEGQKAVFVTLMSPGRGGVPVPGKDPIETASTPTGQYKITGKFATATMVAPGELVHSDVPWAQNFSGPHALHGAYWHNEWGEKKSGGCVNVSPIDGKHLFEWTEPAVPPGWHGVRWLPKKENATIFLVRR